MIPRAAAIGVALLVTGCASLPPAVDAESWPARRAGLQVLEQWSLTGRVAVAAGAEGFSGGLDWRQDGAHAQVEIRGPFGRLLMIAVDGEELSVTDSHGASMQGDAARELVASELGTPLPVGELRYWLIGAPAPAAPYQETMGTDGRPAMIEQLGWRVRFVRYQAVGGTAMPARVEIEADGVRLRLAVADWTIVR